MTNQEERIQKISSGETKSHEASGKNAKKFSCVTATFLAFYGLAFAAGMIVDMTCIGPRLNYHYCSIESQRTGKLCFRVRCWDEDVEVKGGTVWHSISFVTKRGNKYSFCEPDLTYQITGTVSEETMKTVIG